MQEDASGGRYVFVLTPSHYLVPRAVQGLLSFLIPYLPRGGVHVPHPVGRCVNLLLLLLLLLLLSFVP